MAASKTSGVVKPSFRVVGSNVIRMSLAQLLNSLLNVPAGREAKSWLKIIIIKKKMLILEQSTMCHFEISFESQRDCIGQF